MTSRPTITAGSVVVASGHARAVLAWQDGPGPASAFARFVADVRPAAILIGDAVVPWHDAGGRGVKPSPPGDAYTGVKR